MKPDSWQQCPFDVLEQFLDLDSIELNYDPCESSRMEVIDAILNYKYNVSATNLSKLDTAWKRMTDEEFKRLVQDRIRSLEERTAYLKQFCS
jgi:hypothetical protein